MNKLVPVAAFIFLVAGACSDDGNNRERPDHAWQEQTETLDKAKAVEGILKDTANAREQQIQKDAE